MPGNGCRISSELRCTIMQRLKAGTRPRQLEREYGLAYNTVSRMRIGEIPDCPGRKRKLSETALQQAEQRLGSGEKLCVVAADCGVHQHTLHNCMRFRKRAKR